MRRISVFRPLGVFALTAIAGAPYAGASEPAELRSWADKVHPRVLEKAASGPTDFIVFFEEQADLSAARGMARPERGRYVFETLRDFAAKRQAPVIGAIEEQGLDYRSFWIANMIRVRGAIEDVELLARRAEVLRIDANPSVALEEPIAADPDDALQSPAAIEWGVLKILADEVWAMGYTGEGVVIGGQDTGYDWDHPALVNAYRGWTGLSADHDYNWHDSIHSGGGVCGADSPFPCDDHSHGTHTMGTMVGDDGGPNQIGVAPGARWIGCRNMDQGNGTPETYSECFQWFVAPTDVDGQNPDPTKAPDVINNSWTCPSSEGCSHDTLKTVVENTRAAGIVVVASAGNSGSGCNTVSTPPAIYEAALSVGATNSSDNIASFSSRGPVTVDGSNRLKPEVSAPGVNVRSSTPNGNYGNSSGTSMAGPHVVGLIALLLDARPDLRGRVEAVETIVEQSALGLTSGQDCGGMSGMDIPNPVFGYGRIDALESLVGDADEDGSDNLSDCLPTDPAVWTAPEPVSDLILAGGAETDFSWAAPAGAGDGPAYDLLRSTDPDAFGFSFCVEANSFDTASEDDDVPAGIFHYLVRVRNDCGAAIGQDSEGSTRTASGCLGAGD